MAFTDILVEKRDNIATLRINRPEKLNAFRHETNQEVLQALDEIESDDDVAVVILTGSGRAFCTGHDMNDPPEPHDVRIGWHARGPRLRPHLLQAAPPAAARRGGDQRLVRRGWGRHRAGVRHPDVLRRRPVLHAAACLRLSQHARHRRAVHDVHVDRVDQGHDPAAAEDRRRHGGADRLGEPDRPPATSWRPRRGRPPSSSRRYLPTS